MGDITSGEPSHAGEWRRSAEFEINVNSGTPWCWAFAYHKSSSPPITMMSVRTIAGFVASFPSERDADDSPPGRFLAEFIATQLRTEGFNLLGPTERQGWAWEITATVDGVVIDTIIGLVDDSESTPPRQWLITNDHAVGIWSRLFGSRAQRDQRKRAIRKYCEIIHKTIASDDRFSHIFWYNKDTFDRPGDSPATMP